MEPFINGVTQICPKIDPSYPLNHAKMDILLKPLHLVSQKLVTPSPQLCDVIYDWSLMEISLLEVADHFQYCLLVTR